METVTNIISPFFSQDNGPEKYEVIENEAVSDRDFRDLTISGSLFSMTKFRNVTFHSCTFFATQMENCEFIDCHFDNCTFKFGGISHCNFVCTEYQDCTWDFNPIKKSTYNNCLMDSKTIYFVGKGDNSLELCFKSEPTSWNENVPNRLAKVAA